MLWCHIRIQLELAEVGGSFLLRLGNKAIHTKNTYMIIIVKVACSLIAPASAAAPWSCPFSVWRILYQQNCTVEYSISIPPLSYALMGGAISPLIPRLVQFIQVSENRTGILGWGSKVTCIFNELHSKAGFWHPVSICAFYKVSVKVPIRIFHLYNYTGIYNLYIHSCTGVGRNYDMYLRLGMRYEAETCTIVISMNRAFK